MNSRQRRVDYRRARRLDPEAFAALDEIVDKIIFGSGESDPQMPEECRNAPLIEVNVIVPLSRGD